MKTIKNYSSSIMIFLMVSTAANLSAQNRHIYVSLSNSKKINTYSENYISALDAGAVFGIAGNYVYAGGGITVAKMWEGVYSSIGTGIGPDLHIHLLQRKKFKFILEGKGRVMYLFPEYPKDALNYAFWGGPTAEFSLSERHKLKLGICYNHFSNAKSAEQIHNKSLDGLGLNVGWNFY